MAAVRASTNMSFGTETNFSSFRKQVRILHTVLHLHPYKVMIGQELSSADVWISEMESSQLCIPLKSQYCQFQPILRHVGEFSATKNEKYGEYLEDFWSQQDAAQSVVRARFCRRCSRVGWSPYSRQFRGLI
ncbi:hypothetical protein J437_LFUL012560 [Ladona fulva]|uniref:Uncharacterized protein n=1 Tax=Ladona fulva TaxID=123851 RepID=A0A8K0KPM7_LADFU|nr:hypothetical protein J437_LFUL012560 [Ladona fulva]